MSAGPRPAPGPPGLCSLPPEVRAPAPSQRAAVASEVRCARCQAHGRHTTPPRVTVVAGPAMPTKGLVPPEPRIPPNRQRWGPGEAAAGLDRPRAASAGPSHFSFRHGTPRARPLCPGRPCPAGHSGPVRRGLWLAVGRGAVTSPGLSFLTRGASSGQSNPHPGRVYTRGRGTANAQLTLKTFRFTKGTRLGERKLQETPRLVRVATDGAGSPPGPRAHLRATPLAGLPSVLGSFTGRRALGSRGPAPPGRRGP